MSDAIQVEAATEDQVREWDEWEAKENAVASERLRALVACLEEAGAVNVIDTLEEVIAEVYESSPGMHMAWSLYKERVGA